MYKYSSSLCKLEAILVPGDRTVSGLISVTLYYHIGIRFLDQRGVVSLYNLSVWSCLIITVTEVEVSGRGDSVRAAAKARPTGLVIDLIVLIIWGFGGCRGSWIGTNAVNTHVLTFLFVVEPVGVAFTTAVPEAATFLLRLVVVPLDRVVTARSSLIFLITEVHIDGILSGRSDPGSFGGVDGPSCGNGWSLSRVGGLLVTRGRSVG